MKLTLGVFPFWKAEIFELNFHNYVADIWNFDQLRLKDIHRHMNTAIFALWLPWHKREYRILCVVGKHLTSPNKVWCAEAIALDATD